MVKLSKIVELTLAIAAFALAPLLVACSPSKDEDAPYVRFASQTKGAKLSGVAPLEITSNVDSGLTGLSLFVEGKSIAAFDGLASLIELSTSEFKDGNLALRLEATDDNGNVYTDEVIVEIDNPAHRLIDARATRRGYGRGEQVVLNLNYNETELELKPDFSLLDSNFDATRVTVNNLGKGNFEVRYTISKSNTRSPLRYDIPITSTGKDGMSLTSFTEVQFLGQPTLPIAIAGSSAFFLEEAIAYEHSEEGPEITSIDVPKRLIQGQSQTIRVRYSAPDDVPVDRIVFSGEKFSGSWVVPLESPSTSGEIEIPIDALGKPDGISATIISLTAAAVAANGTTSAPALSDMEVITMNLFGVRFLLNWGTSADLDLEVTTPDGSVINYQNPNAQFGRLELDSNSLCNSQAPIPMESIAWDATNIVPGTYGIKVSQFDACGQKVTPYTVTILACGRVETISGETTEGGFGTIEEHELSPYVLDCIQRVRGRITYAKSTVMGHVHPPTVNIPVRVSVDSGAPPISTTTNNNGEYDVLIPNDHASKIVVQADASWTPPGESVPRAQVWGLTGNSVYSISSTVGAPNMPYVVHDIDIRDTANAGAFNILDVMRRVSLWSMGFFDSVTAARINPLVARWTKGKITPKSDKGGSYYWYRTVESDCRSDTMAIWLDGSSTRMQEYSDSIIAHESSHHIERLLNLDDNPGGPHKFGERIAPAFAWAEGLATAFGQKAIGQDIFRTGNSNAASVVDIEYNSSVRRNLSNNVFTDSAYGTDPARDMTGNISEFLVTGIVWDLLDGANEPGIDEIDETAVSTKNALSRYFQLSKSWNRRGGDRRDLIDFLDGWRCYRAKEDQARGFRYTDNSLLMLTNDRRLAYSPPRTAVQCP